MPISLGQVLALDVVQRARPQVVHGGHLLDRRVRWVHTSELVEAAALLKGGELLLTTGLGLAGRGPVAQRGYVEQLAINGAAAIALELGWTFPTVPDPLVDEARRRDLPVITLREIVPFVEITEAVQTRLVHARASTMAADRNTIDLLLARLLRGEGLSGIVDALHDALGCAVIIERSTDEQVAWSGLPSECHPGEALRRGRVHTAPIDLLGEPWGWLHLVDPPGDGPDLLAAVLERGPAAAALALLQGQQLLPLRARQRQEFIDDLLHGRFRSRNDLEPRATVLGLRPASDDAVVGFVVGDLDDEDEQVALYAAEAVAGDHGGLAAEVDSCVLGVLPISHRRETQPLADRLLDQVGQLMIRRGATTAPRVALGRPVHGLESLGRSLREARSSLRLSIELDLPERAVTAVGLDADRILANVVDDPQVGSLIDDRLGPLLRYDAEHGTDLLDTLWQYLMHGSSKTTTAKLLHIRRQTLYQRLARIEELIGDVDDPQRHVSLLLALKAHQLRRRRRAR